MVPVAGGTNFRNPSSTLPPLTTPLKKRGVSYSPCSARSPANVSPSNSACHSFCYCLFLFFPFIAIANFVVVVDVDGDAVVVVIVVFVAVITAERNFDFD